MNHSHIYVEGQVVTLKVAPVRGVNKRAGEAAGPTLAEVSRRSGTDKPALSRLENGRSKCPGSRLRRVRDRWGRAR